MSVDLLFATGFIEDFIFGNRCVNIFDLHTKVVVLLIEPKYNWQVFLFDISLLAVSKRFL